jgi:hypothetical protein
MLIRSLNIHSTRVFKLKKLFSDNLCLNSHNLRSIVPAHHSSYATRWKAATIERDRIAAAAAKARLTTTHTLIVWPHSR